MPVGDLPGWQQIFTEDFTSGNVALGSWPGRYGAKWYAYEAPYTDTSGNGQYNPKKVLSVKNGLLDMWLRTERGQALVAAPVPLLDPSKDWREGQLYGRYSVRFRSDPVPGYKTAWLLWPASDDWTEGEIDFPEGDLNSTISGYSHQVDGDPTVDAFTVDSTARYPTWHIATIDWTPAGVTFYLDGKNLGTGTGDAVPHTAMHWVLQTETQLHGRKPPRSAAGHVQVDWVVAYKYAPTG